MDFIDDHGIKKVSHTQEEAVQKVVEAIDRVVETGDVLAFDAEEDLLALIGAGVLRFRNYATIDEILVTLTRENLDVLFSYGIDSFPNAVVTIRSIPILDLRAVVEWVRNVLEALNAAWHCVMDQLFRSPSGHLERA